MGTVVEVGEEEIDTRVFGSSRARHRARNNRLKDTVEIDGESKMPSLFPFGKKESAADKRKRDDVTYLAAGNNVTPQRKPSLTIDLCIGKTEEVVIDSMVKRVRRRAFVESGVVQEVMDVDTG